MATFEALGHMSQPSSCTEKQSSSSSLDMFNGREEATTSTGQSVSNSQRLFVSVDLNTRNAHTIVFLFQLFQAPRMSDVTSPLHKQPTGQAKGTG